MDIGLGHYLPVAACLFTLGIFRNRGTIAVEDINMMKG